MRKEETSRCGKKGESGRNQNWSKIALLKPRLTQPLNAFLWPAEYSARAQDGQQEMDRV